MGAVHQQAATGLGYIAKANEYINSVLSGKTAVCEWVQSACERQQKDLERAKNPVTFPYRFDEWAAEKICVFVEQLRHVEGPLTGQRIRLEPWQCFFLTTVFGWVHAVSDPALGTKAGKRRFRRVYVEVPRGNGKSALSAGVSLYMLGADGEGGAQCFSVATSIEQAQAVYRTATLMANSCPELWDTYKDKAGKQKKGLGIEVVHLRTTHKASNSFLKALPYKREGKLDSLNVHFAVVDELHAHDHRECYEAIESGMGKRDQSLLWTITTSGSNQAGICYEKHKYIKRILQGDVKDESFFGIIYTIIPGQDWSTLEAWKTANPNWNISVSPSIIASSAAQALETPAKQADFQTKHCNIWVGASSAWMNMQRWNACRDTTLRIEDFLQDECIPGLDLASRLDLAAAVKVFRRRNEDDNKFHYYVFGNYWLPEHSPTAREVSAISGWFLTGQINKSEGDTTDFDLIEENLVEFCSKFNCKEIAFDQAMSGQLVTHLQREFGDDFMVPVSQGTKSMSPAMKEVEALVLEKRIHHNDEVLSWNMANVVGHYDEYGNIKPDKSNRNDPNCKIDGAAAMLNAIYRWTAYVEDEGYAEPSITFIEF
jgi:phage terminase large subunit-like protein